MPASAWRRSPFSGPISGPEGPVGSVQRLWPPGLTRRYRIRAAAGGELLVDGAITRPWTFPVRSGGREVALIQKKWSGVGREMFTDADTFRVQFLDSSLGPVQRRLVVIAALAIDYDLFESGPRDR